MTALIAAIMKWKMGIIDVSQALLQASLMEPSQRIVVLEPWFIPLPWPGSVDMSLDKGRIAQYGFLTLRPLYGTKYAPPSLAPTSVLHIFILRMVDVQE